MTDADLLRDLPTEEIDVTRTKTEQLINSELLRKKADEDYDFTCADIQEMVSILERYNTDLNSSPKQEKEAQTEINASKKAKSDLYRLLNSLGDVIEILDDINQNPRAIAQILDVIDSRTDARDSHTADGAIDDYNRTCEAITQFKADIALTVTQKVAETGRPRLLGRGRLPDPSTQSTNHALARLRDVILGARLRLLEDDVTDDLIRSLDDEALSGIAGLLNEKCKPDDINREQRCIPTPEAVARLYYAILNRHKSGEISDAEFEAVKQAVKLATREYYDKSKPIFENQKALRKSISKGSLDHNDIDLITRLISIIHNARNAKTIQNRLAELENLPAILTGIQFEETDHGTLAAPGQPQD